MSRKPLNGSTEHVKRAEISPALAGFATGASTTILTIAATLVSLRSDASRESLFLVLSWTMYVAAGCTFVIVGWILLNTIKVSVRELHHLTELEAHVPRLIRFRRRSERVHISTAGDALVHIECEVEATSGASAPWLTFPFCAAVDPDGPEWQSFSIRRVSVDGVNFDPVSTFIKRSRSRILNNPRFDRIILEEGGVRVPISLEPNRRRCTFAIEVEWPRAYAAILDADLEDDSYLSDIAYVTDEIDVHICTIDKLQLSCSSRADYRVQATQINGEVLDTAESQLQSANCSMGSGVHWRSTSAKIGYRYEIPISAQRLAGNSALTSTQ